MGNTHYHAMDQNTSLTSFRWIIALLALCLGFSVQAAKKTAPSRETAAASSTPRTVNDFPTQARVEYVSQCMAEHGGANLDNMYHCVCAVDKIASLMNFQDYSEALTFTYMFDTPGDKGGEFRDPPKSEQLRTQLKNAQKEAAICFPVLPGKTEGEKKP